MDGSVGCRNNGRVLETVTQQVSRDASSFSLLRGVTGSVDDRGFMLIFAEPCCGSEAWLWTNPKGRSSVSLCEEKFSIYFSPILPLTTTTKKNPQNSSGKKMLYYVNKRRQMG